MEVSETGGGEILTARTGPRLWSGVATITAARPGDQDRVLAYVDLIRQSGASFHLFDPRRSRPQSDPSGTLQGVAVCTVQSVAANAREITLQGLPEGFVLTPGDLVTIPHGTPAVPYLGRVVIGDSFAAGIPTTATVELVPFLPNDVHVGQEVTLTQPYCKAVYVPNSFSGVDRKPSHDTGFSFGWRQTVR
ncbi:hypothetical protein KUV73_04090 [Mameliella alba]|nr:hypothetical protein [Mameliella alba]MBY6168507.1 hypothetical protein [Mameliella alba]MBY6173526.1 hypothetical protein [Mameliella alba]